MFFVEKSIESSKTEQLHILQKEAVNYSRILPKAEKNQQNAVVKKPQRKLFNRCLSRPQKSLYAMISSGHGNMVAVQQYNVQWSVTHILHGICLETVSLQQYVQTSGKTDHGNC